MIIISSGLPKSASTITHIYIQELVSASGSKNGQTQLNKLFKEGYVHRFGIFNTLRLLLIHFFYGNIVIKTHTAPTFPVKLLIKLNIAKAIYTVRDPRDIVLSAIDHGKKTGDNPFKEFTNVKNTIPSVIEECKKWLKWKQFSKVLFIRYEDIIHLPEDELAKIADYLNISIDRNRILNITEQYQTNKSANKNFNKGTSGRYINEMSDEEKNISNLHLKYFIQQLEYQL